MVCFSLCSFKSAFQNALLLLSSLFQFLRFKNKLWNRVYFSGADSAAHWRQIVVFPKPRRLSRTTGDERNRGRDSLKIVSPLVTFLISVEVKKFPRASSSSAGRPGQVAADRARAGEKFLMAHFPASLSMNRLAGSSGTQKVCEASKSRNRTGSVISKSGTGLSQMPPAMTQRGLRHQSLLELIASFPRAPTRELDAFLTEVKVLGLRSLFVP